MTTQRRILADPRRGCEQTPEEKEVFAAVIRGLTKRRIRFMLAGAFGVYHYTGYWRNTKDMDVLVTMDQFGAAIQVVQDAGMADYYPVEAYDRSWIYRSHRGDVIVDVIHGFPNHVDEVDAGWLAHGRPGEFAGEPVRYVSPEDLIWMKLFVFQHERCDWPDSLNIIRGLRGELDWKRLLRRTGEHWRLLGALVEIYTWLCPAERQFIPPWLRAELARRRRRPEPVVATRKQILDSRPWLTDPGAGLADASRDLVPDESEGPDPLEVDEPLEAAAAA